MQEALKNPHHKKIWEKVIMNRHKDCDSIEKALLNESTHKGSLIALDDKPCHILPIDDGLVEYDFMRPNIAKLIHIEDPEVDDIQCEVCNNYLSVERLPSFIASINKVKFYNPQILGRPITLEDILSLLKNKISAMPSWDKVEDRLKELNPQCCTATNKATKYTYNSYTQEYLSSEYGRAACEHVLFIGLMIGIQRFWQLTKPLHEQTPEIWEKIANLI